MARAVASGNCNMRAISALRSQRTSAIRRAPSAPLRAIAAIRSSLSIGEPPGAQFVQQYLIAATGLVKSAMRADRLTRWSSAPNRYVILAALLEQPRSFSNSA